MGRARRDHHESVRFVLHDDGFARVACAHRGGLDHDCGRICDFLTKNWKRYFRIKPRVVSSQIIRHVDAHQVQLINRMRHGHMLLAGQTLYVLEVEPAAYAALAANEAEKAALINILEVRAFGSFGRVYLGGEERDIMAGYGAAVAAIESVTGREADTQRRD